jgi:hypothetical protein
MDRYADILVATDHGRFCLSAANLEIGIRIWIDAQIEQCSTGLHAHVCAREKGDSSLVLQ